MTIAQLAKDFTELLRQGKDDVAAKSYNADDIASYEAMEGPMSACIGREAVKKKSEWWAANHEVHAASIEGPFVNGNQFAVRLTYDLTPKSTGKRIKSEEVGLYTVRDGKIVEERFFY